MTVTRGVEYRASWQASEPRTRPGFNDRSGGPTSMSASIRCRCRAASPSSPAPTTASAPPPHAGSASSAPTCSSRSCATPIRRAVTCRRSTPTQRAADADDVVAALEALGRTGVADRGRSVRSRPRSRCCSTRAESELGPVDIVVNNASGWIGDTFRAADARRPRSRRARRSRPTRSTASWRSTDGRRR